MIYQAKEVERKNLGKLLDKEDSKDKVFAAVKQMISKNKDVVGGGCVKDAGGNIVVESERLKDTWRSHFEKLANEEFNWDKNSLGDVQAVSGPSEEITCQEVRVAMGKMKNGKAAGPSGVVVEMLEAAGELGVQWMTDLCNAVVKDGTIPADWTRSWMLSIYKGKGDAMECGSYRGIKLLEHAMKVLERVLDTKIRDRVKIDEMQFGFRSGKSTIDAIFIVRQMQEKYLEGGKELWLAFVDLEKAFDRVPREVLWWALRELGVEEWIVNVIKSMYAGATTMVKLRSGESKPFEVKVGVHQGSVLSPLLFIIVMEALSRKFREGLPYELLFADDLVTSAVSEKLLMENLRRWKESLEAKGMRVNMGKTKVMKCGIRKESSKPSGKWPCGVCGKGVGKNSIECTACLRWVHKKCSGIIGPLVKVKGFQCSKCVMPKKSGSEAEDPTEVMLGQDKLECVDKFCYLGDMIGAGGGAEEASRARVRCAWGKFNELLPILTTRGASLKLKGKIYRTCVQIVLMYGSETWPMKVEDMQRLERTERAMVRWMCGVSLKEKIQSVNLLERLGIMSITELVLRHRLRWYGHVLRREDSDWVLACMSLKVGKRVSRGRPKMGYQGSINRDMKSKGLEVWMAQDRDEWSRRIMEPVQPAHARKNGRLKR